MLRELEAANRSKEEFLANLSHELRTPLNAILGWADMLRHGTLDGARRERAVQAIYSSATRQAQLVDELLDVARIMSGKLALERAPIDSHDAVRRAVDLVQPAADCKRVQIAVDADASAGAIDGDSARLQQIVWNLLTNAVKFTPEGGTVHVRARRSGAVVELAVADTGPGIPAEFLPFIFDAFRQADGSTTRRHGGLGLGLSIVKQLVDAHGGTIRAESGAGRTGSVFTVRLPAAAAPAAAAIAAPIAKPAASLRGVRVLVVDDDEESREMVAAQLQGLDAAVLTAASAAQAWDVLQREAVHVLLADISMPVEDGYALIRRVRACGVARVASIPAAALTSFAAADDRQRAVHAGFQLHLAKPVDRGALVDAVATLGALALTAAS